MVLTSIYGYSYYNNQLTPDLTAVRQHGKNYGVTNTDAFWSINLANPLTTEIQNQHTENVSLVVQNEAFFVKSIKEDIWHVQIYNVNGMMIYSRIVKSGEEISRRNLYSGTYIVKIMSQSTSLVKKIVVV